MTPGRRKALAGTLVIGNEILLGRTRDTNTIFLAEQLLKRGIKISRWVVVQDDSSSIEKELKRFIEDGFELVIVSGGMGPTHDDITVAAVAKGLGLPLRFHHGCYERMVAKWRKRNPEGEMPDTAKRGLDKMAYVPQDFDLIDNNDGMVEGLVGTANKGNTIVFILPGVPREYQGIISTKKFQDYLPLGHEEDVTIEEVLFRGSESRIATFLKDIQERYPDVEVGSYPQGPKRVVIRVTGTREEVKAVVSVVGPYVKDLES